MKHAALLLLLAAHTGCFALSVEEIKLWQLRLGPLRPPYDAIVVPGCPSRRDGGVSTCIARRVAVAARAFRDGYAPRLVVSGAAVRTPGVEAIVMAAHARALGVPQEALIVDPLARHTVFNFQNVARLLLPSGRRRVLIVTDPYQMPTAVRLARRFGLVPAMQPTVAPHSAAEVRRTLALDEYEPLPLLSWH